MRLKLPRYIQKSKTVHVNAHMRAGKKVDAHDRHIDAEKKPKKKTAGKVNFEVMQNISTEAENNIAYIIWLSKHVSGTHGIPYQFEDGQPVNDTADLVAEGRMGMLQGGVEWETRKDKKGIERLQQMKTRARQRMLNIAKKLNTQINRPRDFVKHQTIINHTIEKLTKEKGGHPPTPEEIADNIKLSVRTKESKMRKMNYKERLQRIYQLAQQTRYFERDDDVWQSIVGEEDIAYWSKQTQEEREIKKEVSRVLEGLVSNGNLSREQYRILKQRYYLGEKTAPTRAKAHQTIANEIWEKNKPPKKRKKVGDIYRIKLKTRKRPYSAKIVKIVKTKNDITQLSLYSKKPPYFIVQVGDKRIEVKGEPPFKTQKRTPSVYDIIEVHAKAMEIIKPHLQHLAPLLKKSISQNRIREWISNDYKLTE